MSPEVLPRISKAEVPKKLKKCEYRQISVYRRRARLLKQGMSEGLHKDLIVCSV